ncbi:MAG TPA: hypothetical protein VIR31_05915 [Nitrososphaeraceae archaeon]
MTDINKLNNDLKEIKKDFDKWNKSGLNREVLEVYLKHKTKLPLAKVKLVLDNIEDFFENLIQENAVENL